jgi:uncharacterized protein
MTAALKALPEGRRDESLAFNEMGDNLARLEDIGDARVAAMDEQGIDMHILSLAPPATGPLDPADAVALSRKTNDIAVEAVRRHPSRLRVLSTLPMAEPKAVAGELERAASSTRRCYAMPSRSPRSTNCCSRPTIPSNDRPGASFSSF